MISKEIIEGIFGRRYTNARLRATDPRANRVQVGNAQAEMSDIAHLIKEIEDKSGIPLRVGRPSEKSDSSIPSETTRRPQE